MPTPKHASYKARQREAKRTKGRYRVLYATQIIGGRAMPAMRMSNETYRPYRLDLKRQLYREEKLKT